jgi:hypothetical protein
MTLLTAHNCLVLQEVAQAKPQRKAQGGKDEWCSLVLYQTCSKAFDLSMCRCFTLQELAQAKQERRAQLAEGKEERAAARALEARARKMAAAAAAAQAAQRFGEAHSCAACCCCC